MLKYLASAFYLHIMNVQDKFKENWNQQFSQFTNNNCHLLLAVSGGSDSVILTDLVAKAGFEFTIAHCNFQLREDESERDEAFVIALGNHYEKKVLVKRFHTKQFAEENKIGIQEAARILRYNWFNQNIEEQYSNNGLIVTAHHADDNIETVLINFFRGTGLQGLKGIQPYQQEQKLIRPLLCFRKEELLLYAKEQNLAFVEDSSNQSDKYTRNYFRNQLIPSLKEVFTEVEENILHNIKRFKEAETLYSQAVQQHKIKLLEQKGNEIHIPILKLKQTKPLETIVWEIIKNFQFSAAQTVDVIKLLDAGNSSFIQSATHRIIKNRKWLIIAELQHKNSQHILIEQGEKEVVLEKGILQLDMIQSTGETSEADRFTAFVDADSIQFPLLLRKWKQGDYFYPLGMQKKKKLSRFMIDQKLSATDKENTWVIESNKKIIWVIGYRIDDRFKLMPQTKNILKIILT
jgi:tRNA(Ile)-lysidine synthase